MKILACDFDGTLYRNRLIQTADLQAIRRWQQAGNLFVFATGRDVPAIQSKLNNYALQPDYIIGNNGATIDQRILSTLEPALFMQLLTKIELVKTPFQELKISGVDVSTGKPWTQALQLPFSSEQLLNKQKIVTQIAVQTVSPQSAQAFALLYGDFFPQLSFLPNNQMVDIVAATTDKALALTELANQLRVPLHQIFTIGDGLNDVQMLKEFYSASFPWVANDVGHAANHTVQSVGEWVTHLLRKDYYKTS